MSDAKQSGTFSIGGALKVHRLGFGAMRDHRPRNLGRAGRPRRSAAGAEAPARARRRFRRHRQFLRPRRFRAPHSRSAASLSRHGDRDQGRPDPHRPQPVDAARPARIPHPAGVEEPPQSRRRDDRPVAIASHRPQGAARRAVRRDPLADRRQGRPLRRPERSLGRGDRGGVEGVSGGDGAEPLQSRRSRQRGRARPLREEGHRLHSRGSRSPPANSPGRARSWRRRRAPTARRRDRSRSPGCSSAVRSSCRSPAPPRSPTSRRTSPRRA